MNLQGLIQKYKEPRTEIGRIKNGFYKGHVAFVYNKIPVIMSVVSILAFALICGCFILPARAGTMLIPPLLAVEKSDTIPVKSHKDLVYAKHGDREMKLDLYVPEKGGGPFPLVVWIHGGSWISGNKKECVPLNLGYCQNGYAAASLSYRFSTSIKPAKYRLSATFSARPIFSPGWMAWT